jgi:NAD(P)-dependent dehydrogenase (short-subunit alcohol dehydrogenase family)
VERGVALVTGANRGIGLEVCRQLADRGLTVVLGSRDADKGDRAVAALGVGKCTVLPCQLDVTDLAQVREALETNLFGAWSMVRAFLPLLRRSRHARVVNVSSEAGSLSTMGGGTPAHSLSKAALNALTRMLAAELRTERILVNAVCPGWVATDMGGKGGRPVAEGAASVGA